MAAEVNAPHKDTPQRTWNMLLPIALLVSSFPTPFWFYVAHPLHQYLMDCLDVPCAFLLQIFFIFYLLVKTGEDPSISQDFMDKIEASNSYAALLWGTMAAVIVTMIFYLMQIVKAGEYYYIFDKEMFTDLLGFNRKEKEEDEIPRARFLMPIGDSLESFLYGQGRIFPALIVLTLAWASGSIMLAVGADRLFSSWIVGGISPEALPTLSFLISLFMALATGTSWGVSTNFAVVSQ